MLNLWTREYIGIKCYLLLTVVIEEIQMEVMTITQTSKLLGVKGFSHVQILIKAGLIPKGIMYGAKRGMRLLKQY